MMRSPETLQRGRRVKRASRSAAASAARRSRSAGVIGSYERSPMPFIATACFCGGASDSVAAVATFALIHGGGGSAWDWHLVAPALREHGHDAVVLRGGMGAKARAAALARLQPRPDGPPLLAVATGPYVGEGFDCPALDTLFLAAPIAFKGRLVQYAGRVLRPHPGKTTAEVHDYHDTATGVLASSLAKRAPGYTSLGFPDPRRGTVM
jgi:hypothetical protein